MTESDLSYASFWATDEWTQFPPESTWILSVAAGNPSALSKKCCVAPAALLARPECSAGKLSADSAVSVPAGNWAHFGGTGIRNIDPEYRKCLL